MSDKIPPEVDEKASKGFTILLLIFVLLVGLIGWDMGRREARQHPQPASSAPVSSPAPLPHGQ